MTSNPMSRLLLAALLVLPTATPAAADSSPEAQKWLDKLLTIYDRAPFKVDYDADLDMSSVGQPTSGTLAGSLTQADRTRSRMELQLDLSGAPGTQSGGAMSMSMLIVNDGTTVWTEIDNPAFGSRQVTKIAVETLEQVSAAAGGLGVNPASVDPVAQLEALSRSMDFEVVEMGGGTVTLQGTVTDETRAEMSALAAPGVDAFVFVLDETTGFPTEVRAAGENPFVTMRFKNLELVDALPDELFRYSPPEGLPVMDLGPLLLSQQAQSAQQ